MYITYRTTHTQYFLEYLIEHCILAVTFFLPLSLKWSSIFLGLGALLWLGKIIVLQKLDFKATPFDAGIALLVLLSAASILASPDRDFSFYNYYNLMGRYLLLYYLVVNNMRSSSQVKRLIWSMLASAVVVAMYGFYQYFFGATLSALEWVDGEQFPDLKMRIFSTLENPNLLAGFLVTMMAIASGMGYKAQENKYKIVYSVLVIMFGGCLLLTYSRGAWLSVLAIVAMYGMLCNRKVFWLLLLLPVIAFFAHDALLERLMSIMNPTDTSSTLRLALWESTIAMIVNKPFLGIGWGAYWMVYPDYDFFINNPNTKIFHAHNMYLNIAAEIGIPGLITFLTIMCGHLRLALSSVRESIRWSSGIMLGIVGAIFGLIVNGFTDYVMFNIQLSMLFWLLNALIVVVWQQNSQRQDQNYRLKKVI
ncbi:O-antigen ligase family protein [Pelosinus baikalensis]|uniref:O-antigen ligase family protein n=1 Tax=Pelosinus baikalensis TaxID=2892015 RepID=A0ABS8HUA6_9FIRM|nr:O-antigen ligase family protein [Pelosinus baikalensis]MCC5466759.1 O-antigen ligase family protein [Pelosinus baikalensis]